LKKILITQSNYIPWKGYFDAINQVDEVVLYDEVQFTKRDWRNRNIIKTPQGISWLTIPVEVKGKYFQKISETKSSDKRWNEKHWKTLKSNYTKSPCYLELGDFTAYLYAGATMGYLSEINYWFLTEISKWLGIRTKFVFSNQFNLNDENPTQRLVSICKEAGASHYYTGPAAKAYLEEDRFAKENIQLIYLNYEGYQEYPQLHPPYIHGVTILDLLFNTGRDFSRYMKSFENGS
jgi:WbqC-like protein